MDKQESDFVYDLEGLILQLEKIKQLGHGHLNYV